ncbi:maleylpyruvate isomerase family mycothiol-dependent enzyme [Brevibacterium oceani]|uniref:maleylpyruvate isomerase family mycothiol-dependent enzyme n=1 Tax=Brevibacterium oceani TaxID=358099 RepID=UPI0015E6B4F3|nr:maleylpyruvate isomerase family mycothiol-dependent enzyme [Brevibacterium oceani]
MTAAESAEHWKLIHAERARLLGALEDLSPEQFAQRSLCDGWSVDEVVAHLSAAANTGRWTWIRSIVRSGFDPTKHNARLLSRYRGRSPAETVDNFREAVTATIAPTKDYPAFLGEVVVHSQDIALPLGIELSPDPEAVASVARYFAAKDFAVNSKTLAKGLRLRADDADFDSGSGPMVTGRLLDLVMAMAGRPEALRALNGDGVAELRTRMS